MSISTRLPRRAFLAAAAPMLLPTVHAQTPVASPTPYTWPTPVAFSDEVEIVDWRLFPTPDVMRFIAEIRNVTDTYVIAPAVGVIILSLADGANYGWGVPNMPVIYPGDSTFVMGVAPAAMQSDNDWTDAKWVPCTDTPAQTTQIDRLKSIDYDLQITIQLRESYWFAIKGAATNLADSVNYVATAKGHVREANGRICGGIPSKALNSIRPGKTLEYTLLVRPDVTLLSNPFTLVDSMAGGEVFTFLQPRADPTPAACPLVMPWNR